MLTIVLENTDYASIVGPRQAPTLNELAQSCGIATDYHGIPFSSVPNYLGLTSGQVPPALAGDGVNGVDCPPSPTCLDTDPSVFTQGGVQAAANPMAPLTWRTHAENVPANCEMRNVGTYAARHNPAVYYPNDAGACAVDDVPTGTPTAGALGADLAAGTLPNYDLFIHDRCNDGHNSCNGVPPVVEENTTLTNWMPAILASLDYTSGHLLVITADSSRSPANGDQLATVLVNPDVIAGTQADRLDHYWLLRLNEEPLGVPPLANAATAADMAPAFNLPVPTPPTS